MKDRYGAAGSSACSREIGYNSNVKLGKSYLLNCFYFWKTVLNTLYFFIFIPSLGYFVLLKKN